MGVQRLPGHVRRQIPDQRESRKRPKPADTGRRDLLQAHGVESELELILLNRLERAGLPRPETQVPIVFGRQLRFDRCWVAEKVAVEVQGGTWSRNGHARPSMVQRDCLKFSIAAALGWRVLPITREMIEDGQAVELIAQALGGRRDAR